MSHTADIKVPESGVNNLPDILGNLRIVQQNHLPAVAPLNPFGTIQPQTVTDQMQREIDRMFGPKCECPNTSKLQQRLCPTSVKVNPRFLQPTILNQKPFKQRKRNDLKLLREPTLRLVEQCLLAHPSQTNSTSKSSSSLLDRTSGDQLLIPPTNTSTSSDRLATGFSNWSLDGTISDFKSLVRNCESLTLSGTHIPDLHKSRSFRTQQTKSPSQAIVSRRKSLLLPRLGESSSSRSVQSETNATAGGQQRPTCSQQALMNQAADCDVTIDELACYFETFVHIPKKMSSMAEMMYI